jgi:1,4-alpha-glucan branching enzyme
VEWVQKINQHEGGFDKFSRVRFRSSNIFVLLLAWWTLIPFLQGYESFGLIVLANGDIWYREWAPNAVDAHLIGDFSLSSQFGSGRAVDMLTTAF